MRYPQFIHGLLENVDNFYSFLIQKSGIISLRFIDKLGPHSLYYQSMSIL